MGLELYDQTVTGVGLPQANIIWGEVSTNYAARATGNVTAILDMQQLSYTGVFIERELPALLSNRGVTQISIRTAAGSSVIIPAGTSVQNAINIIRGLR